MDIRAKGDKMKVEIWSDVVCPFCYIGKRKFETALAQSAHASGVDVIWRSFQLAPDMTATGKSIYHYLADHMGVSVEEARRMNDNVTKMAAQVGLTYDFDKTVVANSFNAHRFSHFAAHKGKQDAAEELLFHAYFTEGKNIDDAAMLVDLGVALELDPQEIKTALEQDHYADEVRADISEAQKLAIRGVPFFVFNRKYAVSGAQESGTFLEVLDKSFTEWRAENPMGTLAVTDGPACKPGGSCG